MQLYKISFTISPKVYIGISSISAEIRFKEHKKSKNSLVSRAIRKYGKESTILTILAECDNWELLCLAEQEAIEKFNSKHPNGYNLTDGGDGAPGVSFSSELIAAMRLRGIAQFSSPESRKQLSDRTKKYFKNNPEMLAKNTERMKNMFSSESARKALSITQKTRYRTNPMARLITGESVKNHYIKNPSSREKASEKSKAQHSDPLKKIRHRIGIATGRARTSKIPFSYIKDKPVTSLSYSI